MVRTGLDHLVELSGHTSVTSDFRYGWDVLVEKGLRIKKVFSPEHGMFGTEQDQKPVGPQPRFAFEVVSLYGEGASTLKPIEQQLCGIDLVIYDIQDIGTRYYTYVNSLAMFMQSIDSRDIEFVVLDRPNPLGGDAVEGPVLQKGYESFVGILPVPVRHGMTSGELALLARDHFDLDVDLNVVKMTGWTRGMHFGDTGLAWVPPSPNMPTVKTAFVYPGTCLVEGVNISEGRGTTTPFEQVGAPGIDPYKLSDRMNSLTLPGVYFRPIFFKPTFNKFSNEITGGVYIHVTDYRAFRPFYTGVALVSCLHSMHPGFKFLEGVYEFNSLHPAFDLLTGSSLVREMILSGTSPDRIAETWEKEDKDFSQLKKQYSIYDNAL
jgi:uncharacterized protein YbbC (DUF1343 family)